MKNETLHAIEMTREIRDRMYEETKELGGDDLINYFREKSRHTVARAKGEQTKVQLPKS